MKKLADIRTSHKRKSLKPNVSIGEYTYGNPNIIDYGDGAKLTIGKFCSIADNVTIILGGAHALSWPTTFPFTTLLGLNNSSAKKPKSKQKPVYAETCVGNDVWIGYGSFIRSGVTIGDGAIVGAKTVVSKDVEPYSIVVGNPPKLLRYRYPENIREILLEKKWWDLPDEKIEKLMPFLLQPDINKLIEQL